MSNKKVPQDIIELEHYFNKYFDAHIAPLADKAVKDADAAYLKEYQQMVNDSGVFSSLTVTGPGAAATMARSQSLDSYQYYWSNIQKSFQKRFESSSDFKTDFGHLIDAYQKAMISKQEVRSGSGHMVCEQQAVGKVPEPYGFPWCSKGFHRIPVPERLTAVYSRSCTTQRLGRNESFAGTAI